MFTVGEYLKAELGQATVGNLLEGKVHEAVTVVADRLFQAGLLTREERIAISGAVGKSLDKFDAVLQDMKLFDRVLSDEWLGAMQEAAKSLQGYDIMEAVVNCGGELKAMPNGRVGGYLVVFSPHGRKRDLVGDYFTKTTKFLWAGQEIRPAIYHHGLDPRMGKKQLGSGWHFGHIDDVGLWVETQLKMREEYEAAIYHMSRKSKLGLSSGTASHMIEKEADGRVTLWPIVEGSFTPTPAETRTSVQPLRSILPSSLSDLISSVETSAIARPRHRGRGAVRIRGASARAMALSEHIRNRTGGQ